VEEVERPGQILGGMRAHEHGHVPDPRADVFRPRVVLVAGEHADFLAERHQVPQARLDLIELLPRRLRAGVGIPLHAVARNAEGAGGAEHLLGAVRRADLVEVGRHQRDRHAALPEGLGEFRQILLDARRLDMAALAHGGLDALEAESGDDLGELVVRQPDEMLREQAELRRLR